MKQDITYLDYQTTFQDYFIKEYWNQKPCIIRGSVTQWSASNWDFSSLKTISYHEEDTGNLNLVYIRDPKTQLWQKYKPSYLSQIRKKLNIKTLEYSPDEWVFSLTHPEMLEEIIIPAYLRNPRWLNLIPLPWRPIYPRLLIGYADTGSQLHVDICNTPSWMSLLVGTKRWFVVDPQEGQKLNNYLDVFTPNTFELKEKLETYYEFDLQAGEIIYLPGKWLHQVYNLEDSIAITYNLFNLIKATFYLFGSLYHFKTYLREFQKIQQIRNRSRG